MRDNSTLLHRLELWAQDQPEAEALVFKNSEDAWQTITASQYWTRVVRIAEGLRSQGLEPGEQVWIYAFNSPDWVMWELGIFLAGLTSVGVHPHLPDVDLGHIYNQTQPRLILLQDDVFRERLRPEGLVSSAICTFLEAETRYCEKIPLNDQALNQSGTRLLSKLNRDATQLIVYTSGTTGIPKGVMLGLRQLTFVADVISREWKLPFMEGSLFSFLPLAHIAEKIQSIAIAITQRYTVHFNSKIERLLPELKEVRPTLLLAVPRIWERFKERVEGQKPKLLQRLMEIERLGLFAEKIYLKQAREEMGLDRLKLAVSGAVKLAPPVAEWFKAQGIEIQEIYGMSEACGLITLTHPERKNFTSVGTPPPGIQVKVSENGEILVKGPQIFQGYWQDSEASSEALNEEGFLRTGDLGSWAPELEIYGRTREIIKMSTGRMISPIPIENLLKQIPEVSNVCVMGEGLTQLVALITLKEEVLMEYKFIPGAIEGLSVEDETLKAKIGARIQTLINEGQIKEKIGRFIILARDFRVEDQELTATHKLNRNRIQQNFKHYVDLQLEG